VLKKIIFLACIACIFLNANTISLKWLEKQPRSFAKDFYIYQYLNQNATTPQQAKLALNQSRFISKKIFFAYTKKSGNAEIQQEIKCMRAKISWLIHQNKDCLSAGFTTFKALKIDPKDTALVLKKLKGKYQNQANILNIVSSPLPFKSLVASGEKIFFDTFNECGSLFRDIFFDYDLSKKTLNKLQNNKRFNKSLTLIITDLKLVNLQKSLFDVNTKYLNFTSTFLLAMNAIKYKKIKVANKYLNLAKNKAYFKFDLDRILFWKYLINKNEDALNELANSWNINIYSLYAMEILHKKPKNIVYTLNLENYKNKKEEKFNIHNPFAWIKILNTLEFANNKTLDSFKNRFAKKNTQGQLAFILRRENPYRKSYFISPFDKYTKQYSLDKQALIYAIARQESHFIPTSISPAFALGVMQVMPFLSKALSKDLKDKHYRLLDQLNPKINIKYANYYLNYLQAKHENILLIAYAYNGGIGFLNRQLKKGLFNLKSKYEPFLSMELYPLKETRRYAKKVLANYYIYTKHFDKNSQIKLSNFFTELKNINLKNKKNS